MSSYVEWWFPHSSKIPLRVSRVNIPPTMGHDEARIAMRYFNQLTVRSSHAEVAPESKRDWDLSIIYERGESAE